MSMHISTSVHFYFFLITFCLPVTKRAVSKHCAHLAFVNNVQSRVARHPLPGDRGPQLTGPAPCCQSAGWWRSLPGERERPSSACWHCTGSNSNLPVTSWYLSKDSMIETGFTIVSPQIIPLPCFSVVTFHYITTLGPPSSLL